MLISLHLSLILVRISDDCISISVYRVHSLSVGKTELSTKQNKLRLYRTCAQHVYSKRDKLERKFSNELPTLAEEFHYGDCKCIGIGAHETGFTSPYTDSMWP